MCLRYPLPLCLLLHIGHILIDCSLLLGSSQFRHPVAFRSQHHEGHTEHSVRTCREYDHIILPVSVICLEHHLRPLRTSDPVALHILEGICPVQVIEIIKQTPCIGRHPQLPLRHLLLLDREASSYGIPLLDLIIGQHCSELRTPVDGCLALIGYTVVHQHIGFLLPVHRIPLVGRKMQLCSAGCIQSFRTMFRECLLKLFYRSGFLQGIAVIAAEHLKKSPLGPLVIFRVTCTHFTRPVIRKAYPVQLFTVPRYILRRRDRRMLAGLDCILLSGKAERIVPHRMKHVEPAQSLVPAEYVTGYIPERMADMKSRPRWIREHIKHVILRPGRILHCLECLMVSPV